MSESDENIEDEIPPITILSKSLKERIYDQLYPDGLPYQYTKESEQRWNEQFKKGPIGFPADEPVPEDWAKIMRQWRRGMGRGMDFTPVVFCRLLLSMQQVDNNEAILHLSFENLWDKPFLCYFTLPGHVWWGYMDCGLEAVDQSGEKYRYGPLIGATGFRPAKPSASCWIEPGRFYTHTERVVRRDDNQWHFCGKEGDSWYWSAFSVPSQATYRLKWTYMGLPSNTIVWTAP